MDILEIFNEYGRYYVVKIHEIDRDGNCAKDDPLVSFHRDGRGLEFPDPLYSYYASTLLEGDRGLLLYGSDYKESISEEDMARVRQFITDFHKKQNINH